MCDEVLYVIAQLKWKFATRVRNSFEIPVCVHGTRRVYELGKNLSGPVRK